MDMTRLAKTIISLIIVALSSVGMVHASHCYSYTIKAYFDVISQGDSLYFEETIKDGNEVTYVTKQRIKLEGVTNKDFKIVSKDRRTIIFIADGYYYFVTKSLYGIQNYGVNKLFPVASVKEIVSNCFFLVNGEWHYVQPIEYSNKIQDKILPALKGKISILADYDRGEILLKDENKVYVFYESSTILKPIPKLTASSTNYRESEDFYGEHFLYDDDTFYLTTIRFIYRDITTSFNAFGKTKGFSDGEFVVTNKSSFDTKDGLIWMFLSGGKTIEDYSTVFFYPLTAHYLNSYRSLYSYDGKIYPNNWSAANKSQPMDVSIVKDLNTFRCTDFGYSYQDSLASYIYESDNRVLKEVAPKISKIDSLKTDPDSNFKPFALGYTYGDKIVIENTEIENIANKNNLEFIGSTIDVIQACDNRIDQTSVRVLYNCFFKDDSRVYFFQMGQDKLSIIENISPSDYKVDDYDDLMKLNKLAEKYKTEKEVIF